MGCQWVATISRVRCPGRTPEYPQRRANGSVRILGFVRVSATPASQAVPVRGGQHSVEEPAWSILTWTWKRDGQTTVHLFKVRPTCNAHIFASITTTAAAAKGEIRPGSRWNCGTRALTAVYVIAVMERAFRLECSPPLHGMPPREIPHRASPGAASRTRQTFIRPMVKSSALHRGHAGGAASPGGDAR